MKIWKILLIMALGPLEAAAMAKIAEDENHTGKDDALGEAMQFIVVFCRALLNDKPLPRPPKSLETISA